MVLPVEVQQASPSSPRTRRALLGAGLGALAATVVGALGRPREAQATHVGYAQLGHENTVTSLTTLTNSTNNSDILKAVAVGGTALSAHSQSGKAVYGSSKAQAAIFGISESNFGVYGTSGSNVGVYGQGNPGVRGTGVNPGETGVIGRAESDGTGVMGYSHSLYGPAAAPRAKTGVYGVAAQENSFGVVGRAMARGGRGVAGEAEGGVGVYATATTGYGLQVAGRLRFDKVSGVASIAAGATSVTVTPGVDVNAASFVLLTPKANIGSRAVWFTTDSTNDKVTIRMSSSRASSTPVAWLLIG